MIGCFEDMGRGDRWCDPEYEPINGILATG